MLMFILKQYGESAVSKFGNLYLPKQSISVPKGNDAWLVFTTYDEEGKLEDISGAQEIVFAVWNDAGGAIVFQKTLTGSDITIHGDDNRFSFWVNDNDMTALF